MTDVFVEFVRGSKGMDTVSEPSELEPGYSTKLRNLSFIKNALRTRFPTVPVSLDSGSADVASAFQFVSSNGTEYLVRVTGTGVDVLTADGLWTAVSGVTLTRNRHLVTFAGWNDRIMICNGMDYIYEINPVGLTGTALPTPGIGHFLTVWAGRTIMVKPDRMVWSVRNDNTDWTGIGSGYEDLRSVPEGVIGKMLCLFPVSDETALLFKSDSVWQVTQTGIVDAPFRFNRLHSQLSLVSPYAASAVPGGVIGLFDDGVYIVSPTGITPVGETVARTMLDGMPSPGRVRCAYDKIHRRAGFIIPSETETVVWMFHMVGQRWTQYTYSFTPQSINPVVYSLNSTSINELTGTIDELTGTINELGTQTTQHGFIFTDDSWVYVEQDSAENDYVGDFEVDVECVVISPNIEHNTPSNRVRLQEVRLLYSASVDTVLSWYVSSDCGATWILHSTSALVASDGNGFLRMRKPFVAEQLMVKATLPNVSRVKLLAMTIRIQDGALRPSS